MISLSIWLYGKPNWDIPIEGSKFIDPCVLLEHAGYLYKHLCEIAILVNKLQSNGWELFETYGAVYSLDFYKNISLEEAEEELFFLKIQMKEVNIEEVK
ncbi:MAG TPA: hypothetical protein VJG30_01350 [Candidatus Nanoarchaeia archaeon]|nr:hypothetical protein [Candidatus Nanoarchaeia archaeon]